MLFITLIAEGIAAITQPGGTTRRRLFRVFGIQDAYSQMSDGFAEGLARHQADIAREAADIHRMRADIAKHVGE